MTGPDARDMVMLWVGDEADLRRMAKQGPPRQEPGTLYGYPTVTEWKKVPRPGPVPVRRAARTGRNEPCPCGSGRKRKRCCTDALATGSKGGQG